YRRRRRDGRSPRNMRRRRGPHSRCRSSRCAWRIPKAAWLTPAAAGRGLLTDSAKAGESGPRFGTAVATPTRGSWRSSRNGTDAGVTERVLGTVETSRVAWVDYGKGFCIVLVVMMHSTLGVETAAGQEG